MTDENVNEDTQPDTDAAEEPRNEKVSAAVEALSGVQGNDKIAVAPALAQLQEGNTSGASESLRNADVADRQPVVNALGILDSDESDS